MPYYDYQEDTVNDIIDILEIPDIKKVCKICLAAACASGKSYMSIGVISRILEKYPYLNILVLAHGQNILRSQFYASCTTFEADCEKLSRNFKKGIVYKSSEMETCYKMSNVVTTIPQTIKSLKFLPHFDLVVIDEGHQFYFAPGGMVEKIIKMCGATKQLALTGTPSPYIRNKWPIISIPTNELFPKYIKDVIVELISTPYSPKEKDYDLITGEIKREMQNRILNKKSTNRTLDNLLDFICKRCKMIWRKHPSIINTFIKGKPDWIVAFKALKKTMIACKSQKQARDVKKYFENKNIKTLLTISDDQDAEESQATFDQFKTDPECPVLIVVGRGVLGFNYQNLANVIDMTCSTNIDRIFQLLARLFRIPLSNDIDQKLFLKVAPDLFDNYKGKDYFHHVMTAVLCLTDKEWFTKYDGKNFLQLKIPKTPTHSDLGDEYDNEDDEDPGNGDKKHQPSVKCWLGIPAVSFFKTLLNKDVDNNHSYEYTTLAMVKRELLGINVRWTEEMHLATAKKLIEWSDSHEGKCPSCKSDDPTEKELGEWVISQKTDIRNGRVENGIQISI